MGIDDPSDLLGFAPGAIVEIDAFYFGKNKAAAGVNNQARVTSHRVCLVFCERGTARRIAVWVDGETKREIKENLEKFVSPNCEIFCTDGA